MIDQQNSASRVRGASNQKNSTIQSKNSINRHEIKKFQPIDLGATNQQHSTSWVRGDTDHSKLLFSLVGNYMLKDQPPQRKWWCQNFLPSFLSLPSCCSERKWVFQVEFVELRRYFLSASSLSAFVFFVLFVVVGMSDTLRLCGVKSSKAKCQRRILLVLLWLRIWLFMTQTDTNHDNIVLCR